MWRSKYEPYFMITVIFFHLFYTVVSYLNIWLKNQWNHCVHFVYYSFSMLKNTLALKSEMNRDCRILIFIKMSFSIKQGLGIWKHANKINHTLHLDEQLLIIINRKTGLKEKTRTKSMAYGVIDRCKNCTSFKNNGTKRPVVCCNSQYWYNTVSAHFW